MQTKEQQRSAFALQEIQQRFGLEVKKEVANFIVGVPTILLVNGLGQTLAFLLSKQEETKTAVCQIIQKWLVKEIPALNQAGGGQGAFLQKLSQINQGEYLCAQREALALLQWLKRYARAFQKE